MRPFSIIVAVDAKGGIGRQNTLAWHLPADLKHFKEITTGTVDPAKENAVIMGRRTWESLPPKFKPLPKRCNIILSAQENLNVPDGISVFKTLDEALIFLDGKRNIEGVFVIGGAQVYAAAIGHPSLVKIFVTELQNIYPCDVFFPDLPHGFFPESDATFLQEKDITYRFVTYVKR